MMFAIRLSREWLLVACLAGMAGCGAGKVTVDDSNGTGVGDSGPVDSGVPPTALGAELLLITAGTFSMASGRGDPDEYLLDHEVTVSRDFWLGRSELTRTLWDADPTHAGWPYATEYPCTGEASACPAVPVTWSEAAIYLNGLSANEGFALCYLEDGSDLDLAWAGDPASCPGYRLPTEAEWEYAARAGQDTEFSGSDTAGDVAWTSENAVQEGTFGHEVCQLSPNAWGLCDMSGNAWEWTGDWYDAAFGGYGDGGAGEDPAGPTAGEYRVIRGGDWNFDTTFARVARRTADAPVDSFISAVGLRVARTR